MVQWLELCTSTAGGTGSIPGWGTKIPQAAQHGPANHPPKHHLFKKKKNTILLHCNSVGERLVFSISGEYALGGKMNFDP